MFHSDTQALLELWSRMARDESGRTRVPGRRELRPEVLGARLARTFLVDSKGQIRLAGGWIETLHDRALGDTTWLSAWQSQSRIGIELALRTTLREARPLVLSARIAEGQPSLEIALVPLRDEAGHVDLILGQYTATATLSLSNDAPRELSPLAVHPVGAPGRASLTLASLDGRRIA